MRRSAKLLSVALGTLGALSVGLSALVAWGPYLTPEDAPVPRVEYAGVLGGSGDSPGQGELEQPVGVAVSPAGEVFVSDSGHQRIAVFGDDGHFLRAFGHAGEGDGELGRPMHLELGAGGLLYVAEYLNDRISVFEPTGRFVRHIEPPGVDAPGGVAIGPGGALYVADFYGHRILVREAPGAAWTAWGAPGRVLAGSLHYPTDVAAAPDGSLWVADAYNDRIQRLAGGAGTEIAGWGLFGLAFGFRVADGLGVDDLGRVWAVDFYGGKVRVFDPDGTPLLTFGEAGRGPGQLHHPTDIAVAGGRAYVADFGNDRIEVWRIRSRGAPVSSFGRASDDPYDPRPEPGAPRRGNR